MCPSEISLNIFSWTRSCSILFRSCIIIFSFGPAQEHVLDLSIARGLLKVPGLMNRVILITIISLYWASFIMCFSQNWASVMIRHKHEHEFPLL